MGAGLCTVVAIGYALVQGSWLKGLLAGLTLGMAILPEEFPVVLTIFLALGAWRISQRRVLTRRAPAVETLGSATVICTDKTGTLTLNEMTVSDIYANGKFTRIDAGAPQLPEEVHTLIRYSVLSSQANPFDPMEKAMKALGEKVYTGTETVFPGWQLQKEYPLSPELLSMSRVWRAPEEATLIVAAKGAPEAIGDLCHLPPQQMKQITEAVNKLAEQAKRVIAVARASTREGDLPAGQHDFDFEFLGLLGLEDPVRPAVRQAVEECYSAGIRVIMITGDYPATAKSIAVQIGLNSPTECITGAELEAMKDEELKRRITMTNIFARMVPEQKLRLVTVLKDLGEVVAMTGDGVNDAPALKAAHIGIAMGARGTDVARAIGFTAMVVANIGLILTNRSWTRSIIAMLPVPNPALWLIVAGALALILATVYVPFISPLFQFQPFGIWEMLYTFAAATAGILLSELLKAPPFRRLFMEQG